MLLFWSRLRAGAGEIRQFVSKSATNWRPLPEIGFKLAQTLFRKVVPTELEVADAALTHHMYELNVSEQWDRAILVGEFAISMPMSAISSDNSYRTAIINLAQAYKWSGNHVKAEHLINGKDWSSCGDNYNLALAVLRDDYSGAARYMRALGSSSSLNKADYLDWPIFREFRNRKEFLKTYEEIFGEPFMTSLLEVAEGENTAIKSRIAIDMSPMLPPLSEDRRN